MSPGTGLGEEGAEGSRLVVQIARRLPIITRLEASVRLNPVLEAVELPTGVADLHSRLADVHGDDFTLKGARE